ncbi:MAG: DUF2125 domain-containing protein [Rhodothalassiaceae bacterium]
MSGSGTRRYGRRIRWLAVGIAAAVIGYGAYWFSVKETLEQRIEATIQRIEAAGGRVRSGRIEISGFPSRTIITLAGLQVTGPDGAITGTAGDLVLISHPWTPGRWIAKAGAVHLAFAPETPFLTLTADRAEASFRLDGIRLVRLDLVADGARLSGPEAGLDMDRLTANLLREDRQNEQAGGLREPLVAKLALRGAAVDYGSEPPGSLDGIWEIHGRLPGLDRASLASWRDAGGTLELMELTIGQGPTRLVLSGTLSLDTEFRLFGALTAEGTRLDRLVALMGENAVMPPARALAAASAINQVAQEGQVQLPLLIQDGQIALDTQPLMTLPPLYRTGSRR